MQHVLFYLGRHWFMWKLIPCSYSRKVGGEDRVLMMINPYANITTYKVQWIMKPSTEQKHAIKQTKNTTSFLDVAPCSPVEVYFNETARSWSLLQRDCTQLKSTSTRLHVAISQKSVILILAAIRIWNLKQKQSDRRSEWKKFSFWSNGQERVVMI
jgi:hypothetical protein